MLAYSGWLSCATTMSAHLSSYMATRSRMVAWNASLADRCSRSPMCWLTIASPPTTSAMVFFRSAPTARIGRGAGRRATTAGAYPRARRRMSGPEGPGRTTESSTRRAIGRAPTRNASAMPSSRTARIGVIVGDGFTRTIRARHHQHVRGAGAEQQMVDRRVRQHHAKFTVIRRDVWQRDTRRHEHNGPGGRCQQRLGLTAADRPATVRRPRLWP